MAHLEWSRSLEYAACSTTREADSTALAATDLRDIDILSRAPRPRARFISTISTFISIITLRYSRTALE